MQAPLPTVDSPPRPNDNRPGTTLVSLVAAKAGREAIWILITGVFVIVEALVFITELPAGKLFHRREASKVAGHGRR